MRPATVILLGVFRLHSLVKILQVTLPPNCRVGRESLLALDVPTRRNRQIDWRREWIDLRK